MATNLSSFLSQYNNTSSGSSNNTSTNSIDTTNWSSLDKSLSASDQAKIAQYKSDYAAAQANNDTAAMKTANTAANAVRNAAGYDGGTNGLGTTLISNPWGYNGYVADNVQQVSFDADAWKQAYLQQQLANYQNQYESDLNTLAKNYSTSKADYESSLADAQLAYENNMEDLYANAYANNKLAAQQAASRGLTSSAQGLAMQTAALMDASNQASNLANDRDTEIAKINLQLDRLAEDYNTDKATLARQLGLNKISAMSTAEITALEKQLETAQYNSDSINNYNLAGLSAKNNWLLNSTNNEFTASENAKDRELETSENALDRALEVSENALDRELQKYLAQISASSYSGYSGKSYGSSKKSSSSSTSTNVSEAAAKWYDGVYNTGTYSDDAMSKAWSMLENGKSVSDVGAYLISTTNSSGGGKSTTPVGNDKFSSNENASKVKYKTTVTLSDALKNLKSIL